MWKPKLILFFFGKIIQHFRKLVQMHQANEPSMVFRCFENRIALFKNKLRAVWAGAVSTLAVIDGDNDATVNLWSQLVSLTHSLSFFLTLIHFVRVRPSPGRLNFELCLPE